MKNIAVPLLLASSARAQPSKRPGMKQDYMSPVPMLIADSYTDGACVDAAGAVTAASTASQSASSALALLVAEVAALDLAVSTALTAKTVAVDAVISKDTEIKTLLATDDTEQQSELTLKGALDTANYNASVAVAAATAASTAKSAADLASTGEISIQTAMNTAATNAATHYTAEGTATTAAATAVSTASAAHGTANGLVAGLQAVYGVSKSASDTQKGLWDAALVVKTNAASEKSKAAAIASTAAAALLPGTAGSVAETKATNDGLLVTALSNMQTETDLWKTPAIAAVTAMKTWVAAEAYTNLAGANAAFSCAGTSNTAMTSGGPEASSSACEAQCTLLTAWAIASGLPSAAAAPDTLNVGTGQSTGCYAIAWGASSCLLFGKTLPTADAGSQQTSIDRQCKTRNKSAVAATLYAKNLLAVSSGALYTSWHTTKLALWQTASGIADDAFMAVEIATKYNTKIIALKAAADSASGTADTDYTNKDGVNTTMSAKTVADLLALTNKNTEVANLQATWDAAVVAKTIQDGEESRQLVIKTLADGDKAAQDTKTTAAGTAATDAATAKTTADTASTTAATAATTAATAYTSQVTVAATAATAVAPGITALGALRVTAATAGTDLGTAQTNLGNQKDLIATDQGKVDAAVTAHLAALVACKVADFDKYTAARATAIATRDRDIATIEGLVDNAKAKLPLAGAAGARCEKAISNGTMRPKRDEKICAETLCCGAAKIPVGSAMMIVETCQLDTATVYSYAPPRAPMATTMPAGTDYTFTCIQGAKNLAAGAAALASALYMLA